MWSHDRSKFNGISETSRPGPFLPPERTPTPDVGPGCTSLRLKTTLLSSVSYTWYLKQKNGRLNKKLSIILYRFYSLQIRPILRSCMDEIQRKSLLSRFNYHFNFLIWVRAHEGDRRLIYGVWTPFRLKFLHFLPKDQKKKLLLNSDEFIPLLLQKFLATCPP